MGCTQSKIENEEAVTRCKDRKQFMKEAVATRNAFAAAHSAYAMSLKNTGAALSDYAQGEVQNPQHHDAATLSLPSSSTAAAQPPLDPLPPPPPPPSLTTPPAPIQRAASMPEMKMTKDREPADGVGLTIVEENDGDDEEDEIESNEKLIRKRSSRRKKSEDHQAAAASPARAPPPMVENSGSAQAVQDWDYWFPPMHSIPPPSLEVKEEKENVVDESKGFEEIPPKREEKKVEEKPKEGPPPPPPPMEEQEEKVVATATGGGSVGRNMKKGKLGMGAGTGVAGEKRVAKGSLNMLKVFVDLDDHCLKASESAHEVLKMLEAKRLHYHSNFADNRGHIDHSARVMRVITWNRSFRGVPNLDDVKDDFDLEEHETHATVLDKLLAWEKKLYDEVKAGEIMKFDYQKKVAILNKQKKRGTNSEALEKIKAAVSHLHTRYIVDMQSMDSTVLEINRLRDEELYPKLVQLVDGMGTMWGTIHVHHKSQFKIVLDLKSLDISQAPKETTQHHHDRTIQLWAVVQDWHSQFCKLMDNQKQYIRALNNWLKLNLIPIESTVKEKVSSPPRVQTPPIQRLLLAWRDNLEKLPDEMARTAIGNFAALINTIVHHQEDEMKLKEKCEETRKELSRKTRQFEDWYHKYVQRRTEEELNVEGNTIKDAVAERTFAVEVVKKRLEEEEELYKRQCIAVREKSLTSLKNHLPELFKVMYEIAFACSEMYTALRNISQYQKPSQSSS